MKNLKHWTIKKQDNNRIDIACEYGLSLHLFILENDLFRVAFSRHNQFRLPHTWAITPSQSDIDWQGRDKWSTEGFSLPQYTLIEISNGVEVFTSKLKVIIHHPLWLEWQYLTEDIGWQTIAQDRKSGAYLMGISQPTITHFMQRKEQERYYGLGEKSGDLNRYGRRFEMRNLDAMGYNAEKTDPLYKHIPFYITYTSEASYGLYYDNLCHCWFDLGNELDNYHSAYRLYRADDGDLDYYFILGPQILDVIKKYSELTGGMAFSPKWSLGYSGSTMHYTDASNAQEQLKNFVNLCRTYDIPCDSFQLSSGYTSIGEKRYVFNWNHNKFPNPRNMVDYFHQSGMKLAANIKPCLLQDHPMYDEVAQKRLFIRDSLLDIPEKSMFWDGEGSHLDFTNPETILWWKQKITAQLLEYGIDSTWNDNNEFEIWDDQARCCYFGSEKPIKLLRPLMPLLMMKASYEAQITYQPELRPYLISRSGSTGMNRYVQTWSGDNRTNWNTLKYNIKMGLGMSLSGLYNLGHDVGGFSGPKPDPELFIRWVQNGVMHPRFTIHSWNDDYTVNEPWMYPEVTHIIRSAIQLRYKLIPYLYHLLWKAHQYHEPILRPTFLDHEQDLNTFEENDDYLLGTDLLIASVVEPNQREREVYLPDNKVGWYDFITHKWYDGARHICAPAPLEYIPIFIKAGSVIPCNPSNRLNTQQDNYRELLVMPFNRKGECDIQIFDDDGKTFDYLNGHFLLLDIHLFCDERQITMTIRRTGSFKPQYKKLHFRIPQHEQRSLYVNGRLVANNSYILLSEID
ncbi:glycoside hydrolase family 31 protein [Avibacterium sp. 20-15]|uniref:glycoside hydrolase family 31 protein n=1 Tax=unclassified Avibacterium TaxID=2685287 RepID=UPI002026ECE8|nr:MULTISPECIES: glycoside hydrolase family 31 protein [unclassified Avibacterium]MCW9732285.1 glycoside hydrolase family 31 protein [Avibacterium sp. 20-15]URL04454.1 glycoside hydrolase family 31 protein [Avibacterium sp. 20-132]